MVGPAVRDTLGVTKLASHHSARVVVNAAGIAAGDVRGLAARVNGGFRSAWRVNWLPVAAHCTVVPTSQIVGDDNMYGSRGALVAVYAPHITESYVDPDYPGDGEAYVIPRGNGALVGVIGSGRAATRGRGQLLVSNNVTLQVLSWWVAHRRSSTWWIRQPPLAASRLLLRHLHPVRVPCTTDVFRSPRHVVIALALRRLLCTEAGLQWTRRIQGCGPCWLGAQLFAQA